MWNRTRNEMEKSSTVLGMQGGLMVAMNLMNLGAVALPLIELGRYLKAPVRALVRRIRHRGNTAPVLAGNPVASVDERPQHTGAALPDNLSEQLTVCPSLTLCTT
jgi:hypothetical protein